MIRYFDRACMVQLYAPDEQLKQSIVEKMAQRFTLNLNEEAKRYIIAQPFSSINQILGDMTKLAALVEENQQIDQQLCQKRESFHLRHWKKMEGFLYRTSLADAVGTCGRRVCQDHNSLISRRRLSFRAIGECLISSIRSDKR